MTWKLSKHQHFPILFRGCSSVIIFRPTPEPPSPLYHKAECMKLNAKFTMHRTHCVDNNTYKTMHRIQCKYIMHRIQYKEYNSLHRLHCISWNTWNAINIIKFAELSAYIIHLKHYKEDNPYSTLHRGQCKEYSE
jgi:hypothetical protein